MDLYKLFASVANMSVTASWMIGVVLLARLTLKRAPKIFSYVLWSVVLFRLLCPVSLPSPVSLLSALELPAASSQEAAEITGTGTETGVLNGRDEVLTESPSGQTVQVFRQEAEPEGQPETDPQSLMPLAAYVWLAGGAVMLLAGVGSYLRFRRHLMSRYRLHGNVYLVDHLGSAFVAGLVRPKIYLPSDLQEEQMEYIIAHEKHHIARLDHVVKHLSYFALCLHWFNPLVWVAFILSGKDMEMSCDEAVLKKLGSHIRADYSASLLRLAMGKRILAGSPLSFGEGDTKGRIKNLARWKQLKKWQSAVCALLCLGILTACAANPTQEVVKSKNDGAFDANVVQSATTPTSGETEQNISWQEQFTSTDGSVNFTLDAQTTVPVGGSPVVEVQPHFFTGEEVQRVAYTIFGEDVDYYEALPLLGEPTECYSKQEIQTFLTRWSQYTSQEALDAALGKDSGDSAETVKGFIEKYTAYYEIAADNIPRNSCQWKFQPDSVYMYSAADLETVDNSDRNSGIEAEFTYQGYPYRIIASIRDREDFKISNLSIRLMPNTPASFDGSIQLASLLNTDAPTQETMEEAQTTVMGWLNNLGLGTWAVDSCETSHYTTNGESDGLDQWTFTIHAVPVFEGAAAIGGVQIGNLRNEEEYASNYYMTEASFTFNADGILTEVQLWSPVDVVQTVNENAATLSMDDLLKRAMDHLSLSDMYEYGFISEDAQGKLHAEVAIDRIDYGLMRVKVPDTDDRYYYVPGIAFWGSSEIVHQDTGEVWDSREEQVLLILNAIDGSVINFEQG